MADLADWISYGKTDEHNRNKRKVRRWLSEARGHFPIIDRVNYSDFRGAGEYHKRHAITG